MPPDTFVLIIGAMKAATTTLYQALIQHPHICACVTKEPEFFSEHQGHKVDANRYFELWPDFDPTIHTRCLEGSTGYTKYPHEQGVPERIRDYGLDPKFIYIVRNPFSRIESHLNFRRIRFNTLDEKFTDSYFVDLSRYGLQITQYLKVFPNQERYWIVDFDQILQDQQSVVRDGYRFMGVDDAVDIQTKQANRTHDTSMLEVPLRRLGVRRAARKLFPESARRPIRTLLRRWTPNAKQRMTDADRARIHDMLHEDMQRFRRLTGLDVSGWGF